MEPTAPTVLHTVHLVSAYLFVAVFAASVLLGIVGLIKKKESYLHWGAKGFVASFLCLCVPYVSGFFLQSPLLASGNELLIQAVKKHHDLSKFVLTGSILMFGACAAILRKYQHAKHPGWLWPNLLFISWMVATFIFRSVLHAYRIPAA